MWFYVFKCGSREWHYSVHRSEPGLSLHCVGSDIALSASFLHHGSALTQTLAAGCWTEPHSMIRPVLISGHLLVERCRIQCAEDGIEVCHKVSPGSSLTPEPDLRPEQYLKP